jgi:hypothetical protein
VYTDISFEKLININVSPYDLKNQISTDVNQIMGINNFNIILAGTPLYENNNPINCNIKDINILEFVGEISNNCIPFYIKSNTNDNRYINELINNRYINDYSINNYNINQLNNTYRSEYYINNSYINDLNSDINDSNTDINDSNSDINDSNTDINDITDINNSNTDINDSNTDINYSNTNTYECPICYIMLSELNIFRYNCIHQCCINCRNTWLNTGAITCPLCRQIQ